ncbi:MAG: S8 family serine peptidase [candidate division Zixibacteria bacterium]|nr:S8 family serine peptidase [candidate division Zixibacteria bacterium]MDH3937912.1 S8 family serine peptidase [candidate division Zixibacteria bacterium]MDH4033370.1 S8 family serine peptidase [candidate division Zixibacteria bacterium]
MTNRWTKVLFGPLLLTAALWAMPTDGHSVISQSGNTPKPYIIEGKVTVVFEEGVDLSRLNKGFGRVSFALGSLDPILDQFSVTEAHEIFPGSKPREINSGLPDYTRFYELSFPEETPVREVVDALLQNPNVRTAEPVWAMPLAVTPDDPQFNSQWHMTSLNVNVRAAWDREAGSDSIIVADVDSGVNYNHSDLRDNIWVNPGEDIDGDGVPYDIDDLNGIDDDGNGTVDDLIGYDFLTGIGSAAAYEDNHTPDPDPQDRNGHGTHVGGIMAEVTNNGVNGSGMAGGWLGGNRAYRGVRIMCLRVGATGSDGNGYVNSNNCGTALQYAARNGAKIANASWGSSGTTTMNAAMQLCDSAGMTVTHAAGNDNIDQPDYMDYDPFGFEVLSVASVESNDCKTGFSNFGYWVDISGYGSAILSTASNSNAAPIMATYWGTSMASPHVAGLAALIRSQMPSLTKYQVDSIIINTAHDVYAGSCNSSYIAKLGSGRIDAEAAMAGLACALFTSDVDQGEAPLTVNFSDQSPYSPTSWDWSFGTGDISSDQNPTYVYNDPGVYDVSLIVDDTSSLGPGEEHLTNYIWVTADTVDIADVVAPAGFQAVLPVYMHNTAQIKEIQFSFYMENTLGVTFDSISTEGLRTAYFESITNNSLVTNKKYGFLLKTDDPASGGSNYLQPDTGAILNIFFNVPPSATGGEVMAVDSITASGKRPRYEALWGELVPVFSAGSIEIQGCIRGDVDCSGGDINIADLVYLVDFMFNAGPAPDPYFVGNIDGLLLIDIADLVYMVDFMFNSGPPPPP